MKLSIVIVNYNTKKLLIDCLSSLFNGYRRQFNQKSFEVIVVDNDSHDGSVAMLKKEFPDTHIVSKKVNIGFSKANNLAISQAKGDYLLFLNPDTIVYRKTLTRLTKYLLQHEEVGIVTCKVILPNGRLDDASHRGFPTPWRALTHFTGLGSFFPYSTFFNGYHLGYRHLEKIHEIDACVGAFMMIKRKVGEKVGWFDEDYFWYGEDLDLCFKVKSAGFKVMFIPDVSIMHYKGAASGIKKHSQKMSAADYNTRRQATKARFDVMRIFYTKHYLHTYPRWLTSLVMWGITLKQKLTEVTL